MIGDDGHNVDPEREAKHGPIGSAGQRVLGLLSRVRPWVWALFCVGIAGAYALVWPASKVTAGTTALRYFILRWGHSATWVLLALSFGVRGATTRWSSRIANLLAVVALLTYAAFLFTAA